MSVLFCKSCVGNPDWKIWEETPSWTNWQTVLKVSFHSGGWDEDHALTESARGELQRRDLLILLGNLVGREHSRTVFDTFAKIPELTKVEQKNGLELFSEIDTARYKRDFKRTLDKPEGARYVVKFAACLAVELVEAGERVFRRSLRSQMQNTFFLVSDESSDEVEVVRVSHAPGF